MTPLSRAEQAREALMESMTRIPRLTEFLDGYATRAATALRVIPEGAIILTAVEAEQVRGCIRNLCWWLEHQGLGDEAADKDAATAESVLALLSGEKEPK